MPVKNAWDDVLPVQIKTERWISGENTPYFQITLEQHDVSVTFEKVCFDHFYRDREGNVIKVYKPMRIT